MTKVRHEFCQEYFYVFFLAEIICFLAKRHYLWYNTERYGEMMQSCYAKWQLWYPCKITLCNMVLNEPYKRVQFSTLLLKSTPSLVSTSFRNCCLLRGCNHPHSDKLPYSGSEIAQLEYSPYHYHVNVRCTFFTSTVFAIIPFQVSIKALFTTFCCFSWKK